MSELTRCCCCVYEDIKHRALEEDKDVTLKREDGGIAVYVDGEFSAWFMELTDHCVC